MDLEKIFLLNISHEDKSSKDITNKIFSGCTFLDIDVSEIEIADCVFYKCTISGCRAISTKFRNIRFVDCEISDNICLGSTSYGVSFENSPLDFNSFAKASWDSVKLIDSPTTVTGLIDFEYENIEGLELKTAIDSKKNKLIYNKHEDRVNHVFVSGNTRECLKFLWESGQATKSYREELAKIIKSLTHIDTGSTWTSPRK